MGFRASSGGFAIVALAAIIAVAWTLLPERMREAEPPSESAQRPRRDVSDSSLAATAESDGTREVHARRGGLELEVHLATPCPTDDWFEIQLTHGSLTDSRVVHAGAAQFELCETGPWHIRVSSAAWETTEISFDAADGRVNELRLDLRPRLLVRGWAGDAATAQPVDGLELALDQRFFEGGVEGAIGGRRTRVESSDGNFCIQHSLDARAQWIRVSALAIGYSELASDWLPIAGAEVHVPPLLLHRETAVATKVRGVVLDAAGEPASGALVQVLPEVGAWYFRSDAAFEGEFRAAGSTVGGAAPASERAITDESGRFELSASVADRLRLGVWLEGRCPTVSAPFDPAHESELPVEIRLERGVPVSVNVLLDAIASNNASIERALSRSEHVQICRRLVFEPSGTEAAVDLGELPERESAAISLLGCRVGADSASAVRLPVATKRLDLGVRGMRDVVVFDLRATRDCGTIRGFVQLDGEYDPQSAVVLVFEPGDVETPLEVVWPDDSGHFALERWTGGSRRISCLAASADRTVLLAAVRDVDPSEAAERGIRIQPPWSEVQGMIRWNEPDDPQRSIVRVWPLEHDGGSATLAQGRAVATSASGEFRIRGLPPGRYRVETLDHRSQGLFTLSEAQAHVRVVLE